MGKKKSKANKLKLVLYNDKVKTHFQEEMVLKEVVDNLMLSLIMAMDSIEEVDNSRIFGDDEKRHLYVEIMEALEYSIDVSMGGREAFMIGMDLKPHEFYFMKGKE